MRRQLVGLALFVALAPAGCAVEDEEVAPSLIGVWDVVLVEGQPVTTRSDFHFFRDETGDRFYVGVGTAEGCCLHSADMPYTIDVSQTPAHLDYEGTYSISGKIGIFEFVDNDTLDWKTTDPDRPRPTDFAPNEPDSRVYQLSRAR